MSAPPAVERSSTPRAGGRPARIHDRFLRRVVSVHPRVLSSLRAHNGEISGGDQHLLIVIPRRNDNDVEGRRRGGEAEHTRNRGGRGRRCARGVWVYAGLGDAPHGVRQRARPSSEKKKYRGHSGRADKTLPSFHHVTWPVHRPSFVR